MANRIDQMQYSGAPELKDGPKWERRDLDDYRQEKLGARRGHIDLPFFVLTVVILTIGVVMVLSASFARLYYTSGQPMQIFMRQLLFAGAGVALMLLVSRFKIDVFRRLAAPLLLISIILLAAVAIPGVGMKVKGARRWINLGFTTFQPSEIAKLAEIMYFSLLICRFKEKMKTFRYGVLPFGAVIALFVGLLMLEPHISASVIVIALAAILMFTGGTKIKWFVFVGIIVLAAGAYLVLRTSSYAGGRINAWRNPEGDARGDGYQIMQSLYAIGSGGFLGLGIGQGRQKYLYLPEEHNDYIFSIVCEELGYVGAILILLLFALLIVRGFWLALHTGDRYSSLVVTGISSLLAIQVFLNVAVVSNLLPSTGISLPFFSYGGTALLIQLVEMGIILAVSRDIPLQKTG